MGQTGLMADTWPLESEAHLGQEWDIATVISMSFARNTRNPHS